MLFKNKLNYKNQSKQKPWRRRSELALHFAIRLTITYLDFWLQFSCRSFARNQHAILVLLPQQERREHTVNTATEIICVTPVIQFWIKAAWALLPLMIVAAPYL